MTYRRCWSLLLFVPLVLFASCAAGKNSQADSGQTPTEQRIVHITITDNAIQSSLTVFPVSTPYQFVVTNKGSTATNFIIRERPLVPQGQQPEEGVLYMVPSTDLPPGATQQFTYAFPIATSESNLQFTTNLPGPHGTGLVLPIQAVLGK